MRRLLLFITAFALVGGLVSGCGKSTNTGANEAQGNASPGSTAAERAATTSTGGATGTKPTGTTSRATGTTTGKPSSSTTTLPGGVTIPSVPGVPGVPDVPGGVDVGQIQKCVELLGAYTAILGPLIGGSVSAADLEVAQAELEKIKQTVPANIKADLELIEQGIKDNAGDDAAVRAFFSSPEYQKADAEITAYLTTECSGLGT